MGRHKKPITDQILKDWLETNFRNKSTIRTYRGALNLFKKALNVNDLKEYLSGNPDADRDIKQFLNYIRDRPSKTISSYTAGVKVFLLDHQIELKEHQWRNIRRRGFMPKRIKAQTIDRKPSKKQLRKIIDYSPIQGKALFLFLASSGCRIGETLHLRIEDLNMNSDPPRVFIRGETTKNGVGERTVFCSYEAKDAIQSWIEIKDQIGKKNGGTYSSNLLFPFSHATASYIWNNAIKKAKLDQKDPRTGRKLLHLHSLRKYFRTQIGLDTDITHALLGHSEYLDDAYVRLNLTEIASAYKNAMPNVSVNSTIDNELKQETQELKEEIHSFKQIEKQKDKKIQELESQLEYFRSKQFAKDLIAKVTDNATNPFNTIKNVETHKVKIKLNDGKKLAKLMREGYNPTYSDNEIWILEKDIEQ